MNAAECYHSRRGKTCARHFETEMTRTRADKTRPIAPARHERTQFVAGVSPPDILNHLLKLYNRLLAPFSVHLEKRHKISINEFRMLMMIGQLGTTASHEVAEFTGVNTMAISRAVALLRRHRRIEVATDPSNRRRKILRLTPAGRALYEQMLPTTEKVARYLFEALRPDEIMAFDRFVRTVTEKLEARDESGKSLFVERTRPDDTAER
jgi:MarR family transcriptional regulator, lower aerobic nicotinate degradation pathway regulator